jgi:hypothetical protein
LADAVGTIPTIEYGERNAQERLGCHNGDLPGFANGQSSDYSTIGAALAVAGPNSYVIITGTCNENVNITNASNLNVGAACGSTATINGNFSLTDSNTVTN